MFLGSILFFGVKWLDETHGDLPIKKVLTREEWEFSKAAK